MASTSGGAMAAGPTNLEGLDEAALSMFLDAATVLRGQRVERCLAVWTAGHGAGAAQHWEELRRRGLVRTEGVWEERVSVDDGPAGLARGLLLGGDDSPHAGSRLWVEDNKIKGWQPVRAPLCTLRSTRSVRLYA
jgi:hypothetical protein